MLSKFTNAKDSETVTITAKPYTSEPQPPTHYDGDNGFKYLEGFPNCGNPSVHTYVLFALKYLLRLGKKDDIRADLKKAITYLARAYYMADPSNFNPGDISVNFKDWH